MYTFFELMNGYHGARIRNKAEKVIVMTKNEIFSVIRESSELMYQKKLEHLEKKVGALWVKSCDYIPIENKYIIQL